MSQCPEAPPEPVLILGVGNILLSDEGLGVRAVKELQKVALPAGVELLDGGTLSTDLLDYIAGREKVVIIDAMRGGCPPGSVYRLCPDDIVGQPEHCFSLHQIGLLDTLASGQLLGLLPEEVIIFGVEPAKLGPGLELSPEVTQAMPELVRLVRAEVAGPGT